MNTPAVPRRGPSRLKLFFWVIVVPAVLVALYFMAVLKWNYSTGERAGWVQKFSKKGWLCKTWEGELSMISMPGATPEKFYFTVWDDKVAAEINAAMGRRVSLHYDEKVGLPTTCFGETRHWVNGITVVPEIPISPGVMVPVPPTNDSGAVNTAIGSRVRAAADIGTRGGCRHQHQRRLRHRRSLRRRSRSSGARQAVAASLTPPAGGPAVPALSPALRRSRRGAPSPAPRRPRARARRSSRCPA